MGAPRRKNLIARRRRTDDDGEDDEGSIVAGVEDDSSSGASAGSDVDDDADADAEGSDTSEIGTPRKNGLKRKNGEKSLQQANGKIPGSAAASKVPAFATSTADTEAMMNGMKISGNGDDGEVIDLDAAEPAAEEQAQAGSAAAPSAPPALGRTETFLERRRREHDEYKKKRDEDPAFVPNRGGFFMHDQRSTATGQNGYRASARGRGRGRGGAGGHFSPINHAQSSSNPADAPWAHDLHDTVKDPEPSRIESSKPAPASTSAQQSKLPLPPLQNPPPNRSFSRSAQIGHVQMRVSIPGMKDPIIFRSVPINQHTRLPHHRPPLRRDKPVRISLPDHPPRYIFPAVDRSFIFIPRALRPNQQGFGRGRGRGSFSAVGGFASGRNSIYGGSVYSPSVAMSRRSSMAREMAREAMVSPAGSVMSRTRSNAAEAGKPVVRLPPAGDPAGFQQSSQHQSYANSPAPLVNLPPQPAYPLPQKPLSQNWSSTLPMHQPRPQKQVSVADIESPATLNFNPPQQQQQQPFHHQVPVPVPLNGQPYPQDPNMLPHSRRPSHASQRGTPLSQIPERAIHAQPFQPFPYQPGQPFYPQQYPAPIYYYPTTTPVGPPSVAAPTFVPGQQYPYVVSTAPQPAPTEATTQAGTVAHESNGMVYYYDSSQFTPTAEDPSNFPHMTFGPPNGYMIPQPAVFYPPH